MNFYPENQIVEIVVPFKNKDGAAIVPTAITAELLDGENTLLLDYNPIAFDAGGVEVKIVVPGAVNVLQGDELQEVRRLVVSITHATGFVQFSHYYVIEAEQSLQIMRNSFMTFETALMMASNYVNMTDFTSTTEQRQRAALVEAYGRIVGVAMIYATLDVDGTVLVENRIDASGWSLIDEDAFKTNLPSHFKKALRAAQLAEANDILQGNVIAKKHAQGIASETIGESSVTLRAGFAGAGYGGLGSTALALLSAYIDKSFTIGRA